MDKDLPANAAAAAGLCAQPTVLLVALLSMAVAKPKVKANGKLGMKAGLLAEQLQLLTVSMIKLVPQLAQESRGVESTVVEFILDTCLALALGCGAVAQSLNLQQGLLIHSGFVVVLFVVDWFSRQRFSFQDT